MNRGSCSTDRVNGVAGGTIVNELSVFGSGEAISGKRLQSGDVCKGVQTEMEGRIERGRGKFSTFRGERDRDGGGRCIEGTKTLKDSSDVVEGEDGAVINGNNVGAKITTTEGWEGKGRGRSSDVTDVGAKHTGAAMEGEAQRRGIRRMERERVIINVKEGSVIDIK